MSDPTLLIRIADPFEPSVEIAELAVARARQLRGDPTGARRLAGGRWRWRRAVRETLAGERP